MGDFTIVLGDKLPTAPVLSPTVLSKYLFQADIPKGAASAIRSKVQLWNNINFTLNLWPKNKAFRQ